MFFTKKSINTKPSTLAKTLELKHLLILGLAACIGGGIMTQVGGVIYTYTGAGVAISYLLAGIGCILVALPYCELASMISCSGGIYSYTYVAFGRLLAWIMFGCIVGELGLAASIVSVGFSEYLEQLLLSLNIPYLPNYLKNNYASGGFVHLTSFIVLYLSAKLVSQGMNTNKMINNVLVATKFVVLFTFIIVSAGYISYDNITLLPQQGTSGVFTGVALLYFGFTGFTSLANATQEAKNPNRDISIAIILSIIIATIIYILVSFSLAASTHYSLLGDNNAALSYSLKLKGYTFLAILMSIGAAISMLSVIFACLYAVSRVIFVLSNDKLFPSSLSKLNTQEVPEKAIWAITYFSIIAAQTLTMDNMISIASLSAITDYIMAAILAIFFRIYYKNQSRPFIAPCIWILSILSISYLGYFLWFACVTSNAGYIFSLYILFYVLTYGLTLKYDN